MNVINYITPDVEGSRTLWILTDGTPSSVLTDEKDIERHRTYAEGFGEKLFEMTYTADDFNFFCRKIRQEFEEAIVENETACQMIVVSEKSLTAYALHRRHNNVDAWVDINAMEEQYVHALATIRSTRDRIIDKFHNLPTTEAKMIMAR
jgi:hypothetical protein